MVNVDVIMPTFNRAHLIGDAIESVLAQTFPNWRLVVVDDGSTDNTQGVIEDYGYDDGRICIIRDTHHGVCHARNVGVSVTDAPYVAFLDSDNVWLPRFLERMLMALPPGKMLAYSGQNLILLDDAERIIGRRVQSQPYNPHRLYDENFIDMNAAVVRRTAVGDGNNHWFDENLTRFTDWDLWLRIATRHPFGVVHVDEVLGEYRYRLSSNTATITNAGRDREILRSFGLGVDDDPNLEQVRSKWPRPGTASRCAEV
jgi:glycosyltransferase involved in cell wall biosynthesis